MRAYMKICDPESPADRNLRPEGLVCTAVPPLLCSPVNPSLTQGSDGTVRPTKTPSAWHLDTREVCSCLSCHITDVSIRIPPIRHPVMLPFKKKRRSLPSIINIPLPFRICLRRKEKGRNQPPVKHKADSTRPTAVTSRGAMCQTYLWILHNKVAPQLRVTILNFPTILTIGKQFQFHLNPHSTPLRKV